MPFVLCIHVVHVTIVTVAGTYARTCLTIDEIFAGLRVHMRNSYGPVLLFHNVRCLVLEVSCPLEYI